MRWSFCSPSARRHRRTVPSMSRNLGVYVCEGKGRGEGSDGRRGRGNEWRRGRGMNGEKRREGEERGLDKKRGGGGGGGGEGRGGEGRGGGWVDEVKRRLVPQAFPITLSHSHIHA